jgi:hypothetical protein
MPALRSLLDLPFVLVIVSHAAGDRCARRR